jgi:leader peptidase (prepilin peptidase) / N-methyltransferase
MFKIFLMFLGAIFGSFFSAGIYRLRNKKAGFFFGRSICPKCKKKLLARDLVPIISFLLLQGKCRFCHKKIAASYFYLEILSVLAFGMLAFFGSSDLPQLIWSLVFVLVLIFLGIYDFLFFEIPDVISLPAIILALFSSFFVFTPLNFLESVIGCMIGGGFFLALVLLSNGRWMGGGDIRLGALLGALLGWQNFLFALLLASFLGTLVGGFLIWQKKKSLNSQIPFGPFLALGGFLALIFGEQILDFYLQNFF